MPEALDLLGKAIGFIGQKFGDTSFYLEGQAAPIVGNWTDLGRTETVVINGRRVSFSCTAEATRAQFSIFPVQGLRVTRASDGAVFRISGPVNTDDLTHRFALDSLNK